MRLPWLLVVLAACAGDDAVTPPFGGGRYTLAIGPLRVSLLRGGDELVALDAIVLGEVAELRDDRSYDPYWLEADDPLLAGAPPADLRWRAPLDGRVDAPEPGVRRVQQWHEGGLSALIELTASGRGLFTIDVGPSGTVGYVRLQLRTRSGERFYGLGEWPDSPEHSGKLRPMQLEPDLRLEGANNEAHAPIPLLIGTSGWGVFVESARPGLFDVARKEPDLVEITYGIAGDSTIRLHLFVAEHPLDIPQRYYEVTGPPRLPAPWAYGPWLWRDENRDQAEVVDDVRLIREHDLATSALWIDRPYASAVNTFDFDPARFADPSRMIAAAHAAGLRVALWHTPYLADDAEPLHSNALAQGYFPPVTGLLLNGWSAPIDFTNPDAFAWWQGQLGAYLALGIEGFKLDYGEDVVLGLGGGRVPWRFHDGSDERTMHHGYTLLYHRAYALQDVGFLLCRAARWGDQQHPCVMWPGDLDASFARHGERVVEADGDAYNAVGGLPASISMGLSLAASGFAFYGADTGGYRHSPPDAEVFTRWFEQTALSTVMQVGDSSSQPPWVFTPENGRDVHTLDTYRRYSRLHLRLFPYVWSHATRLATGGRPIARALGLAYPELGVHPADTYLLGDDLLVAPVVERGARTRTVVLPPGTWVHWWSGARLEGTVTVDAPLDELPLFVRAGALVPMLRPTIDTLAPATDPGVESFADVPGSLWVRWAPGPDARFELYDGTTLSATPGLVFEVAPGNVFVEGVTLELLAPLAPAGVAVDGAAVSDWVHGDGTLTLVLGPGPHRVEIR